MNNKPGKTPVKGKGDKTERKARLAAELRANLLKRKAQSRLREKNTEEPKDRADD